MKTRIIGLLLAAMFFAASAFSAFAQAAPDKPGNVRFKPGTYQAEVNGRNGLVKVEVTVDATRILAVKVIEHKETAGLSDAPVNQLPKTIVEKQSLAVDAIAGATHTSNAVLAGVKAALVKAGANIDALMVKPVEKKAIARDAQTDIVVIGAGAAGMISALTATYAGQKVLLIEKQGMLGGGDSMLSSTFLRGAGSSLPGDNSTADGFYNYLIDISNKKKFPVNKTTLRTYADRSGKLIDWLVKLGVPYKTQFDKTPYSYVTKDGSAPGPHMMAALSKEIKARNVEYRLNTKATSIIMDGGKATGITVEGPDGKYSIKAKAVILATGGFSANKALLAKFNPTWINRPTTGAKSLTGDGIIMAQAAGSALYNMDQVKANYLCHVLPDGSGVSLTAITNYIVLVNHEGKRFVDEMHPSINRKSEVMMKQTKHEAYAVFDQTVIDKIKLMSGYNDSGYFKSADTLEELAGKIDVDKAAFLKTMKDYLAYRKAGKDLEFGRKNMEPIERKKFYAALVTPAMQSTYGGVKVDDGGRVVNTEDKVIPGLYAAGSTSGHGAGAGEVGHALIVAVVYGQVVAETAVADLKK